MIAICNNNNEKLHNDEKLHSVLFAYESILRADLLPSAKVIAQILVYQGAYLQSGCCITNELIAGFTGLDVATVQRQVALLAKLKVFHRYRDKKGKSSPYAYHFNRNTEEWEVERYV